MALHFNRSGYNVREHAVIANAMPSLSPQSAPEIALSLLAIVRYVAMISLAGVVITVFRPLRRYFGVIERMYILATGVRFLTVSVVFSLSSES